MVVTPGISDLYLENLYILLESNADASTMYGCSDTIAVALSGTFFYFAHPEVLS
jgi:hypothetical protein